MYCSFQYSNCNTVTTTNEDKFVWFLSSFHFFEIVLFLLICLPVLLNSVVTKVSVSNDENLDLSNGQLITIEEKETGDVSREVCT